MRPTFTIPIKKSERVWFLIKLVRMVLQLKYFCNSLFRYFCIDMVFIFLCSFFTNKHETAKLSNAAKNVPL
ncbi:hypothetical protein C1N54_07775 [Priestia megaterium]|nr:hypothetical protein CS527_07825 [Bacillus sp. Y-01]QCR26755.1 hypothetical protein C1N54_07775 [Priestia megaterium]QDZ84284.1 hypothetical protein D0441_07445 [Priestia megaterium]